MGKGKVRREGQARRSIRKVVKGKRGKQGQARSVFFQFNSVQPAAA
jgi:hypothetical protein